MNLLNYDRITHSIAPHLTTAMYVMRGIRWSQTDVSPGTEERERIIEGVAINLTYDHITGESIKIKGVYIPHRSEHIDAKALNDELENIITEAPNITIGDLNLKMVSLNQTRDEGAGILVRDLCNSNVCTIHHTGLPSRPNSAGRGILDAAIFSQDVQAFDTITCQQITSVGSDHMPWLLDLNKKIDREKTLVRNTRAISNNPELRKQFQQTLWNKTTHLPKEIISDIECEEYIQQLENAITQTLDEYAPLHENNRKDQLPQYINQLIDKRNEAKRKAWRLRFNQDRITEQKKIYNYLKRLVQQTLSEYHNDKWTRLINNTHNNRADMWRKQRNLKAPVQRLPHIMGCNNEKETIDALVDAAIVTEAEVNEEDKGTEKSTPFQLLDPTSIEEIRLALKRFKNKKAPGPDKIKADALKLGGDPFLIKYKVIADYLLKTGYYPNRWKIGECVFLHKTGKNHREAHSYRPITLLNIMGKLHERLLLSRLQQTADRLQPPFQHGFTKNRGTGTQILRTGKFITDALAAKDSVAMVSTDLSKAFDSINHEGLTKKLQTADVPNNIIKLIENYLSGRKTYGRFRTTNGEEKPVPHGVPQGSILGPIIFILYVHDVWDHREHIRGLKLSQYADDLCIINRSPDPDSATLRAGWAADTIIDYYCRWGLKCNVDKTECFMFTLKRNYRKTIRIKDEVIEYKKSMKYLGVHLDKTMTMGKQTDYVVQKARRARGALAPIIGWHAKTDVTVKLAVIQACLLPILDYGVVQLLPRYSKSNLLKIERQYRMALKTAGQFPRRLETSLLWDMLDWDPWHLRAQDLNEDMLRQLQMMQIEDLDAPGDAYIGFGQHNPLLTNTRLGEISYVPKKDRSRLLSKRPTAPRPHRL
ncbi:hypothetical protein JYU34_021497 [Plutella xylostella]|uniref:Reverse transcriptase domain-containing protein n=1 Tax=Plutella xylostella TaxID=51655 RepID=A0ABQ7PU93_PLUXY|nr:hypothetical protein JYU34_021497 [Plutella xylostella]